MQQHGLTSKTCYMNEAEDEKIIWFHLHEEQEEVKLI